MKEEDAIPGIGTGMEGGRQSPALYGSSRVLDVRGELPVKRSLEDCCKHDMEHKVKYLKSLNECTIYVGENIQKDFVRELVQGNPGVVLEEEDAIPGIGTGRNSLFSVQMTAEIAQGIASVLQNFQEPSADLSLTKHSEGFLLTTEKQDRQEFQVAVRDLQMSAERKLFVNSLPLTLLNPILQKTTQESLSLAFVTVVSERTEDFALDAADLRCTILSPNTFEGCSTFGSENQLDVPCITEHIQQVQARHNVQLTKKKGDESAKTAEMYFTIESFADLPSVSEAQHAVRIVEVCDALKLAENMGIFIKNHTTHDFKFERETTKNYTYNIYLTATEDLDAETVKKRNRKELDRLYTNVFKLFEDVQEGNCPKRKSRACAYFGDIPGLNFYEGVRKRLITDMQSAKRLTMCEMTEALYTNSLKRMEEGPPKSCVIWLFKRTF